MSTSSQNSPQTVEERELREKLSEWLAVPVLPFAPGHTLSTSTRSPSLYVCHLPRDLQANQISLGNFSECSRSGVLRSSDVSEVNDSAEPSHLSNGHMIVENNFFRQLLDRQDILALFRDNSSSKHLQIRWTDSLYEIKHVPGMALEEEVTRAEGRVAKVVFDLAVLTLLDLSTDQIEHISRWGLLVTRPSRETDTKANILLGLQESSVITAYDAENSSKHQPLWPLVQDLDPDYMKYLISVECKNLLLGNPMAYLTLLLLARILQGGTLRTLKFWPRSDCIYCSKYAVSHRVMDRVIPVVIPPDSSIQYGLKKGNLHNLYHEIERVMKLLPPQEGARDDNEVTVPSPNGGPFYHEVYVLMKKLLQEQKLRSLALKEVMKWVNPIRNIVLQAYSQMIRHDLTFGIVSSHNTSFLMQRVREPIGHLIISPLHQPTMRAYIIQRALWLIAAWRDAIQRKIQKPQKSPDPYKGVKPSATDPPLEPIDDGGDDPIHDPDYDPDAEHNSDLRQSAEPLRRSKRKKTQIQTQSRGSNDDKGNPPPPPPPPPPSGGGAGNAGGSGAGSSDGSTNIRGPSSNKRSAQDSSTRSQAKRGRQHADIDILADEIHLAFNCAQPPLQSSAFSHYLRVTNLSTGSTEFPIPFSKSQSTVTPPRRALAASVDERSEFHIPVRVPHGTPSHRRPSVTSIASGTSTGSSIADSAFWSSPGSTSTAYTVPSLSTPSSPSSGSKVVTPNTSTSHRNITLSTPQPAPQDRSETTSVFVDHVGTILDTKISQSAIGIVWGANMILEGLDFSVEPIRVVVKLADWDCEREGSISKDGKAILKEAEIYEHLAKKAPNVDITPHYYGVFNGSGSIALVLDDGGQRLPRDAFKTLEDTKKRNLFKMAEQLHQLGIEHCDLCPRNILMGNDGDLRIIDFHVSQLGHRCPGPLVCHELRQFAKDLRLQN